MRPPLISRSRNSAGARSRERGFTMALVAAAMVALIGMAALSIDLGTLYQAKTEAQRAADAAALAAARVISVSGITADPVSGAADGSWSDICGGTTSPATWTAINVAQQNLIAGAAVASASVKVMYGAGSAGASATDCSTLTSAFAVNPIVTVNVQRTNLPIFFAKVFSLFPGVNYSGTSVSGTATAEVFNPSDSGKGAAVPVPVQPRCVKPWIIPNTSPGGITQRFVHRITGQIWNEGIYQLNGKGVVGQALTLQPDCVAGAADCEPPISPAGDIKDNPPVWSGTTVDYIPALVAGAPGAVPSCATTNVYQKAIGGCDQNTIYTCGTPSGTAGATQADLTENPVNPSASGDTTTAGQCLINQSVGQDTLAGGATTPTFPFQMQAGAGSPLIKAGVSIGDDITTSNSIVTVPIAEFFPPTKLPTGQPPVTIVGFMQAFITSVDAAGNVNVVVLNVSGCGDAATGSPLYGTSPVPIRLITPP